MRLSRRMWIWSKYCNRWKINQQYTWTRCNIACIRDNIINNCRHDDYNQRRNHSRKIMIIYCLLSIIVTLIRKCCSSLHYYHCKRTGCLLIILLLNVLSSSIIRSTQSFVIDRNIISKNSVGNNCKCLGNYNHHHIEPLVATHIQSHSQSYQQRFSIRTVNKNNHHWNSIHTIQSHQQVQQHDYDIGSKSTIVAMMMNIKNSNNNNNYLDDEEYNDFYDNASNNNSKNERNNTTTTINNNNNNNEIVYYVGEGDLDTVLPAVVSDDDSEHDDDDSSSNNNSKELVMDSNSNKQFNEDNNSNNNRMIDNNNNNINNMNDIYWRIEKLRLEEQNIKRFLKSKPRFLPYNECRKWVHAFGKRWMNEYEWYEWIDMGEKKNPYIPVCITLSFSFLSLSFCCVVKFCRLVLHYSNFVSIFFSS